MEYEVTRLSTEDIRYFESLDPYRMLERLCFPNFEALGVFLEDEDGYETPGGFILLSLHGDGIVVEWIFVNPLFRLMEIGQNLLAGAFTLAERLGLPNVDVKFSLPVKNTPYVEGLEQYFYSKGFTFGEFVPGEWRFDADAFVEQDVLLGDPGMKTKALSDFSRPEMNELKNVFVNNEKASSYFPVDVFSELIDESISCGVYDKGIKSALLFTRADNVIYLTGYYCNDVDELISLLTFSADLISEIGDLKDKEIHILCNTEEDVNLFKEIFQDAFYIDPYTLNTYTSMLDEDLLEELKSDKED
jgi:hypothetical protein